MRRVVLTSSIAATCARADDHHPRPRAHKASPSAATTAVASEAGAASGSSKSDDPLLRDTNIAAPPDGPTDAPSSVSTSLEAGSGGSGGSESGATAGGGASGGHQGGGEDGVIDERHWNNVASEDFLPYSWSKTEAERRAWELAAQQDR